jgi:hypothetical protein
MILKQAILNTKPELTTVELNLNLELEYDTGQDEILGWRTRRIINRRKKQAYSRDVKSYDT